MDITVDNNKKLVQIWLTNAEKADTALKTSLLQKYKYYAQQKYKVAVFESGHGDLLDGTTGLLLHNRKLI